MEKARGVGGDRKELSQCLNERNMMKITTKTVSLGVDPIYGGYLWCCRPLSRVLTTFGQVFTILCHCVRMNDTGKQSADCCVILGGRGWVLTLCRRLPTCQDWPPQCQGEAHEQGLVRVAAEDVSLRSLSAGRKTRFF